MQGTKIYWKCSKFAVKCHADRIVKHVGDHNHAAVLPVLKLRRSSGMHEGHDVTRFLSSDRCSIIRRDFGCSSCKTAASELMEAKSKTR